MRHLAAGVLLLAAWSAGCLVRTDDQPQADGPGGPSADVSDGVLAREATGYWNQSQVETWLKQDLKLVELALTPTGDEGYTGQGRDAQGTTFQLTVTQVPGGIACEFANDAGGQGRISFGRLVEDWPRASSVHDGNSGEPPTVRVE